MARDALAEAGQALVYRDNMVDRMHRVARYNSCDTTPATSGRSLPKHTDLQDSPLRGRKGKHRSAVNYQPNLLGGDGINPWGCRRPAPAPGRGKLRRNAVKDAWGRNHATANNRGRSALPGARARWRSLLAFPGPHATCGRQNGKQ